MMDKYDGASSMKEGRVCGRDKFARSMNMM